MTVTGPLGVGVDEVVDLVDDVAEAETEFELVGTMAEVLSL